MLKQHQVAADTLIGSAAYVLASYATTTRHEALPGEVADRGKLIVFDQLACGYVGAELPAGRINGRYVADMGGRRSRWRSARPTEVQCPWLPSPTAPPATQTSSTACMRRRPTSFELVSSTISFDSTIEVGHMMMLEKNSATGSDRGWKVRCYLGIPRSSGLMGSDPLQRGIQYIAE